MQTPRFQIDQLVRHRASRQPAVILDQFWSRPLWGQREARYTVAPHFGEIFEAREIELETIPPRAVTLNTNVQVVPKEKP